MRSKDAALLAGIERFICEYTDKSGVSPTLQEVAEGVGISKATACRYVSCLCEAGVLDHAGHRTLTSAKANRQSVRVPVLGSVACGIPKYAEENIEEYVRLPASLFGQGSFFILRAYGDSMTEAGIDDGDLVLIRQQNCADEGQIVVALIEEEATLKRFFPEPAHHRVRLHPENPRMDDIFVDDCVIQGVAVKVFKDLE